MTNPLNIPQRVKIELDLSIQQFVLLRDILQEHMEFHSDSYNNEDASKTVSHYNKDEAKKLMKLFGM